MEGQKGATLEGSKMHKQYDPKYIIVLAKKLRQTMTEAEMKLWSKIRRKQFANLRFRRQHPVGRYIADFYCHDCKLIIELDGDIHNERKEYDENRDNYLKAGGYTVLRFSNEEIENSLDTVLESILEHILKKAPFCIFPRRGQSCTTPPPFRR